MIFENEYNYNEGIHSLRNARSAWKWIDLCSQHYRAPRLYHLALSGSTNDEHKKVLKALVKTLKRRLIPCSWRSAREYSENRGEHLHVFVALDAYRTSPSSLLSRWPKCWIIEFAEAKGMRAFVNKPGNKLHKGRDYMSLPPSKLCKLEDAKKWITYLYKNRSKIADVKRTYSASRYDFATG